MHTEVLKNTSLFNVIFLGMLLFFIGLTTSPTLVSGYHVLIFVPTLVLYSLGEKFKLSKSNLILILLFSWAMISTIVNHTTLINPLKAYQDVKYYFFGFFCIGTLQFFCRYVSVKQIKILLNLLLLSIILGFVVGILRSKFGFDPVKWEYALGKYHERAGGFSHYMRYGYSSALMFVLALGAWFNFEKIKAYTSRSWLAVFMTLNVLAIYFSQTRGALLALCFGSLFLIFKYRKTAFKCLSLIGLVLIFIVGYMSFNKLSKNRFANINDNSNKIRSGQFLAAIMTTIDRPIFGLGADQFSHHSREIKKRYNIWRADFKGHAHNIFLEHFANFGVVGGLLFILFFLFWFFEMFRLDSDFGIVISAYIISFLVGGQFELLFDVVNSHLLFFIYTFSQTRLNSKSVASV